MILGYLKVVVPILLHLGDGEDEDVASMVAGVKGASGDLGALVAPKVVFVGGTHQRRPRSADVTMARGASLRWNIGR